MLTYDLIVIGFGKAGEKIARLIGENFIYDFIKRPILILVIILLYNIKKDTIFEERHIFDFRIFFHITNPTVILFSVKLFS